jgi:hypothetical protein
MDFPCAHNESQLSVLSCLGRAELVINCDGWRHTFLFSDPVTPSPPAAFGIASEPASSASQIVATGVKCTSELPGVTFLILALSGKLALGPIAPGTCRIVSPAGRFLRALHTHARRGVYFRIATPLNFSPSPLLVAFPTPLCPLLPYSHNTHRLVLHHRPAPLARLRPVRID